MRTRVLLLAFAALVGGIGARASAQLYIAKDSAGARRLVANYPTLATGRWTYTLTLRLDSAARAYADAVTGEHGAARGDTGVVKTDSAIARSDTTVLRRDSLAMRPATGVVRFDTIPALPGPPAPLPGDSGAVRRDSVPRDSMVAPVPAVDDTTVRYLGVVEFGVDSSSYGSVPSWLLTESGIREGTQVADSLWLDRADLRPRHWSSAIGSAGLALEFVRDTIYGATSSPLRRRSVVLPAPGDLLVNVTMTDLVLRLLPLSPATHDSVSVLVVDVGGAAATPATLTVLREERVVVVAGVFDAWVVEIETERGAATYWVRKDAPVVLRVDQRLPQLGGAVLRRELVRTP